MLFLQGYTHKMEQQWRGDVKKTDIIYIHYM